ncbi:MAG: Lrp/AsnC ligand binding domain-containing protein, partial [Candidatus Hodarchaeota archaeon]
MDVVIVLIKVQAGQVGNAAERIQKVEGVKNVHIVTGPYDIIVYSEIPERSKFRRLVDAIHEAP